ncbi:MAG: hypothetical protein ABH914_02500, partial [Candidatus Omnitrophota bacterium]
HEKYLAGNQKVRPPAPLDRLERNLTASEDFARQKQKVLDSCQGHEKYLAGNQKVRPPAPLDRLERNLTASEDFARQKQKVLDSCQGNF